MKGKSSVLESSCTRIPSPPAWWGDNQVTVRQPPALKPWEARLVSVAVVSRAVVSIPRVTPYGERSGGASAAVRGMARVRGMAGVRGMEEVWISQESVAVRGDD